MRKIINWFKKRTLNKSVILVCCFTATVQAFVGNLGAAFTHFVLALSWVLIDHNEGIIELQDRTISLCMDSNKEIEKKLRYCKCELELGFAKNTLWVCLYNKAKLNLDFCRYKMDGHSYQKKLTEAEESIDAARELLRVNQEKYDSLYSQATVQAREK